MNTEKSCNHYRTKYLQCSENEFEGNVFGTAAATAALMGFVFDRQVEIPRRLFTELKNSNLF